VLWTLKYTFTGAVSACTEGLGLNSKSTPVSGGMTPVLVSATSWKVRQSTVYHRPASSNDSTSTPDDSVSSMYAPPLPLRVEDSPMISTSTSSRSTVTVLPGNGGPRSDVAPPWTTPLTSSDWAPATPPDSTLTTAPVTASTWTISVLPNASSDSRP